MTNVFAVVGEHAVEPGRLLLLGEDGRYYAYAADGQLSVVESVTEWRFDEGAADVAVAWGARE